MRLYLIVRYNLIFPSVLIFPLSFSTFLYVLKCNYSVQLTLSVLYLTYKPSFTNFTIISKPKALTFPHYPALPRASRIKNTSIKAAVNDNPAFRYGKAVPRDGVGILLSHSSRWYIL